MNNNLRSYRLNRLLTQRQLARKAKVALRTIVYIENGGNPRRETKRKILYALDVEFKMIDDVFPEKR